MPRLPKSIIKKYGITKKAWRVFRGRRGRKRTSSGKTRMARRRRRYYPRRRRSRRRDMAIPLAPTFGLVGGVMQNQYQGLNIWDIIQQGRFDLLPGWGAISFSGFNIDTGTFDYNRLVNTYGPMIIGGLISKFVGGGPLHLNRKIPRMIRKYIKI